MRDFLANGVFRAMGVLNASGGDGGTVKVAIVTTAGVVIAAAITSFAATFQRKKAPEPAPVQDDDYEAELLRRAETAEAALEAALHEARVKRHDAANLTLTVGALREFIIELGFNPDTHRKIRRPRDIPPRVEEEGSDE